MQSYYHRQHLLGFHNVLGNKQVIGLNAVEVSQCYKDMKNNVAIC